MHRAVDENREGKFHSNTFGNLTHKYSDNLYEFLNSYGEALKAIDKVKVEEGPTVEIPFDYDRSRPDPFSIPPEFQEVEGDDKSVL